MDNNTMFGKFKLHRSLLDKVGAKGGVLDILAVENYGLGYPITRTYIKALAILDKYILSDEIFKTLTAHLLSTVEKLYEEYIEFLNGITEIDNEDETNKYLSENNKYEDSFQDLLNYLMNRSFINENINSNKRKSLEIEQENEERQLIGRIIRLDNRQNSLDKSLKDAQALFGSLQSQVEDLKSKNSTLLAGAELIDQSRMFNRAAKINFRTAIFWATMIIVALFIFIKLIWHLKLNFCFDVNCYDGINLSSYNEICEDCGEHILLLEIFKSIFFRVLLISVNIYIITFCVKNYNAAMHNKTINEHRHNSYAVAFHLFNNTTSANKDEILSKAADSIFQYQKTGYYGKDSQPTNPNVVQNIFDNFTNKD